ncbi:hypothetical protein ACC684_27555 [Rhizobium ruizarguesonis]|uniref:hypothetical protein n=1 Tax=Rhizobium TaxID=379 RepID=UPI001FD02CA7|nr:MULTISPECIES: hypothetical protein [Rhizobium]
MIVQTSSDEKKATSDKEMRRQLWALLGAALIAFIAATSAYIFFMFHADVACYLASNSIFMRLWPRNLRDADILLGAGYPVAESCILLSMRSITSAVMLIYVFYLFLSQIWVKDTKYIPNLMLISAFLTFGYLYTSMKEISTEPASIYSISTHSSVAVNLVKSYVKICGLYIGFALFTQRTFALFRLKYNTGRGRQ